MESASKREILALLRIACTFLRLIGQDLEISNRKDSMRRMKRCVLATCALSTTYQLYLLRCMAEMQDLVLISEIVWLVPVMQLYSTVSLNNLLRYRLRLQLVQWIKDVFHTRHPIKFIQDHVSDSHKECLRLSKVIFM